jgi:hypothetical protein
VVEAPPNAARNDQTIADGSVIYRRIPSVQDINLVTVDAVSGQRRPSSGAFKPDDDGMSVFLSDVLAEHELGPESLIRNPNNAVVSLLASDPRSHELGVVRDPWPTDTDNATHMRNAAHALITGLELLGAKRLRKVQRDLACRAVWVIDPAPPQ